MFRRTVRFSAVRLATRNFCSTGSSSADAPRDGGIVQDISDERKLGGFAKAFQKYTAVADKTPIPTETVTFASLLRNSKFIDLGDPKGKVVTGEIVDVIENDLYIDFGWKFYCVCNRPQKDPEDYIVGAKVRIMINDLELATRFLGSDTDLTLLEADCRLLNLVHSTIKR